MVKTYLHMNRKTFWAWYIFGFILLIGECIPYCLQTPTYMSEWKVIKSQDPDYSELFFEHGLGEIPIKVVTEINVTSSGNGYIFHAMGSAHRDDDSKDVYGGIVYLYNDVEVRVFAPNKYNAYSVGFAIYTGRSTSWTGPFNEMFSEVYVRVKAWKRHDLPSLDFESSWIDLDVRNVSLIQQEFEHGLGDFPSMVVVQVRGLKNYISEAEGISTLLTEGSIMDFGGVLYGYSNETIRIWIPGPFALPHKYKRAGIMSVSDGWGHNKMSVAYEGSCKIYAWKSLPVSDYTFLGSGDINTTSEINFAKSIEPDKALIITEVQPNDGVNSGFRFPAAACAMNDGIDEPYGGLFYGYNSHRFAMWKPVLNVKDRDGTIFNIGHMWGGGKYKQSTNDVTIRLTVWNLFPEDQVRCWLKGIPNEKIYQVNFGAYYNQAAEFNCLPYNSNINGSRYRTCQRNCTWSGLDLKCRGPRKNFDEKKLRVQVKETSKYKRSLKCAVDNRTSAKVVGALSTSTFSIPAIVIIGSEVVYVLLSSLHGIIRFFCRKR